MWVDLTTLLLPPVTGAPLQTSIRYQSNQSATECLYHRRMARKGWLAVMVHLAGICLTFISPWLGALCAGCVAMLWFLPASRIDRWFADA